MSRKYTLNLISYIALGASLGLSLDTYAADVTQPSTDTPSRTEIKASLEPLARLTQDVAESVGKAIAAEIIASGLSTEMLKHRLATAPRPSKVGALDPTNDPAPGQADQT
jgi:hypothetical protein